MKKFGLLFLGVIIGLIAMYFYCQSSNEAPHEMEAESISAPRGLITPDESKTLDRAYNPRYRLISDSIVRRKGGDNRSSWYALKDVKDYLAYAENEAGKLGFTMDGIRIYLGAYPDSKEGEGYTTMFFVPTGIENKSQGALFNHRFQGGLGSPDIPGGPGLNHGQGGEPPGANYPQ